MKRNFSLIFFLRKAKTDQQGLSSIYMRITVEKKRCELSTGKTCPEKEWENGKVSGSSSRAKTLNLYLHQLETKLHEAHRQLLLMDELITAQTLANQFLGKTDKPRMLTEVFQDHNDEMEALVGIEFAPMTLLRYQTALRHIKQFLTEKHKIKDIDIRKINHEFLTDYDFFLRTTRKCNNNSAVKYIKNLKKIIKLCLANGWINRDPFANFKAKVKVVERPCLSQEEINKLEILEFGNERLNRVRDIFLFSCYTGLAYIDIYQLKRSEIIIRNSNERWLITSRQKTGTPTRIPLLPKAIELLSKYENHPLCVDFDKAFPVSSNQKMNAYLKEIADLCGIGFVLSYHIARHTFATTITLQNGVPIETVSKMLGHKDIRTTQHYAKTLDIKVGKDMAVLREKLTTAPVKTTGVSYNYTITK
ncbi:site-specific integrase [Pedobacter miscanthi]|uniref:Site-specific integrase n=1 Tax=Pedobacter miscanthi TaxID=2259170 RepID=A0A366L587_9SPHI|nr:site-specific integrase [Pedobacter miscanthi]RBQ08986.1 site-specific integrase [Pedobacter miscanthi]